MDCMKEDSTRIWNGLTNLIKNCFLKPSQPSFIINNCFWNARSFRVHLCEWEWSESIRFSKGGKMHCCCCTPIID
jgi:hypothetical protein